MSDYDEGYSFARPRRSRRLLSVVAMIVPAVIFAAIAAWFIQTYVDPPRFKISEPMLLASLGPLPAPQPMPQSMPQSMPRQVATTGSSIPPPAPVAVPPPAMLSSLAFVPPTVSTWRSPREPDAAIAPSGNGAGETNEPIGETITLPMPRPRVATASLRVAVPLPRARPEN